MEKYQDSFNTLFINTGILKDLSLISKYQHIIEKVSGAILIGLAGYFIYGRPYYRLSSSK